MNPTLAAALRARRLQDPAVAAAGGACRRGDHGAEDRLGGPPHLARAATPGAGLLAGPRLGAAATAAVAGGRHGDVDLLFDTGERLVESDGHVVAKIVAAVGPLTTAPTAEPASEERVEDIRKGHIGEIDRRTGSGRRVAEHVVVAASIWI